MKPIISLLIPVCSRNLSVTHIKDTHLFKTVIPSYKKTFEEELYTYYIYFGIDETDIFYLEHQDILKTVYTNIIIVILKNCEHRPTRAWNVLFNRAYDNNSDYMFQTGDDVIIETSGWTSIFIERLQKQNNIGTIAPCEPANYNLRKTNNSLIINENNFVHKTHYDIFGYFFHPEIINWYCDNWITCIYDEKAFMCKDIICKNIIRDSRYSIHQCQNLMQFIIEGKQKVSRYIRKKNINRTTPF